MRSELFILFKNSIKMVNPLSRGIMDVPVINSQDQADLEEALAIFNLKDRSIKTMLFQTEEGLQTFFKMEELRDHQDQIRADQEQAQSSSITSVN